MKKINLLFSALTSTLLPTACILPLTLTSCKNNSDKSSESTVSLDKNLNFTSFSTFKVKNPSKNGFFTLKMNDITYDVNKTVDFFNVIKNNNEELVVKPSTVKGFEGNNKYVVSYNDGQKEIYTKSFILNSDIDFEFELDTQKHFFHRLYPTINIKAVSTLGKEINDITWTFELLDDSVSSYLEMFDIRKTNNSVSITLKKENIEKTVDFWVFGTNSVGQKLGIKLPVLKFITPSIHPSSNSTTITNFSIASISMDVQSGTYAGLGLKAAWNIYSESGMPLNTICKDYTEIVGGKEKFYPANSVLPLTEKRIEEWKTYLAKYRRGEIAECPMYGSDSLEWIIGDELQFDVGTFSGSKGIDNEILKLRINSKYYIPNYGGIKSQCILYDQNYNKVLCESDFKSLVYSDQSQVLIEDNTDKIDLFYNKTTKPGIEKTITTADVSKIYFMFYPFLEVKDYSFELQEEYSGFNSTINKTSGEEAEPVTGVSVGEYLLGSLKPGSTQPGPKLTPPTGKGKNGSYWCLEVELQHQLFLPIETKSGETNQTRSVKITIKVDVKNAKGKRITTFPLSFEILNANRIINMNKQEYFKLLNNKPADISKDDSPVFVSNPNDAESIAIDMSKLIEAEAPSAEENQWQNELYVPSKVNWTYLDTAGVEQTKSLEVTYIYKSTDKEYPEFIGKPKHISFATNSNLKHIYTQTESIKYGVFSGLKYLQTIDFRNATNLLKIGAYSFYDCSVKESGKKCVQTITLPANLKIIGDFAFAATNTPSLLASASYEKIIFSLTDKEKAELTSDTFESSIVLGKGCFMSIPDLNSVENSIKISSIGEQCFAYCKKLSVFDFSYVQKIKPYAFSYCYNLTNINFSEHKVQNGIFDIGTSGKKVYFFEYNTDSNINILFADKKYLFQSSDSKPLKLFTVNNTLDDNYIIKGTNETKISNLSCPLTKYTDDTSGINDLELSKLDLYEVDKTIEINKSVVDLTISKSVLSAQEAFINIKDHKESNLKFITFNQTTLPTGLTTVFVENNEKYINKIQAFTFICPKISESTTTTKPNYNYVDGILKKHLSYSESETKGVCLFQDFKASNILTINIKMSYGVTTSKQSEEDISADLVFSALSWYLTTENGIKTKINGKAVKRTTGSGYDMNTSINWILWD